MLTVYLDADPSTTTSLKRVGVNWANWLPAGVSIDSSDWTLENSDTNITISDEAFDSSSCECYITGNDYGLDLMLKNTIETDATVPETDSRSIRVITTRTY